MNNVSTIYKIGNGWKKIEFGLDMQEIARNNPEKVYQNENKLFLKYLDLPYRYMKEPKYTANHFIALLETVGVKR